jgi:hypothetical protein
MTNKYKIKTLSGKAKEDVYVFESDKNGKPIPNGGVGFSDAKGDVTVIIKNTSSYVTFRWLGETYIFKVGKVPSTVYFKEGIDLPEIVVTAKKPNYWWLLLIPLVYYIYKKS